MNFSGGMTGFFFWDGGVGSSVNFGSRPVGDPTLEITLEEDGILSLFMATDCCLVGDEFALIVDGGEVGWTDVTLPDSGAGQAFEGRRANLFLSGAAGGITHTIDLRVTAIRAPGANSGDGTWTMSKVAPVVPEPSSALLACVGALVLRSSLRRRRVRS